MCIAEPRSHGVYQYRRPQPLREALQASHHFLRRKLAACLASYAVCDGEQADVRAAEIGILVARTDAARMRGGPTLQACHAVNILKNAFSSGHASLQ
jgi:hypothetical protein